MLEKEPNLKQLTKMGYSLNCVDFISKLLHKVPSQRIAARRALGHIWITSYIELNKKKFRPAGARPSTIRCNNSLSIRQSKMHILGLNKLQLEKKPRRRSPS